MIVTLEAQLAIIRSHLASIERQKSKEDWEALAVFLEGISGVALIAADYCKGKHAIAQEGP